MDGVRCCLCALLRYANSVSTSVPESVVYGIANRGAKTLRGWPKNARCVGWIRVGKRVALLHTDAGLVYAARLPGRRLRLSRKRGAARLPAQTHRVVSLALCRSTAGWRRGPSRYSVSGSQQLRAEPTRLRARGEGLLLTSAYRQGLRVGFVNLPHSHVRGHRGHLSLKKVPF